MSRITSFLSITSNDLSAAEISRLLAMEPDDAVSKGSLRNPPRVTPRRHGWYLECRFEGEVDLDFAVASVLKRIEGLASTISSLSQQGAVEVSVKLAIAESNEVLPMFFESGTIKTIGDLGATFDIEYFE
ncbi:DUF4279 domain-containing protein [Mesorhizobium sp. AR02]|uniref:DUF4279 domain-containing protein n=1 Tax=Mesorhizobium sp. AR02 TaxID=2865837 RepID=UPI0021604ADB|nr:DUF4279 domain-containing protein [Mesorhizobium sp. AR02]UVK51853.1 DUF4279 domain-containing protein [Mesorhizobium sp. AR02]